MQHDVKQQEMIYVKVMVIFRDLHRAHTHRETHRHKDIESHKKTNINTSPNCFMISYVLSRSENPFTAAILPHTFLVNAS